MNYRLKTAVLLFSAFIASSQLFAQNADTTLHSKDKLKSSSAINSYRTWSVGIYGGISTPYVLGVNNETQDFTSPDLQTSFGGYIKDQISHSFGLQAAFLTGKLRVDHSQEKYPNGAYIYSTSDTKLNWSASLSGNFIIAHIGFMQPYITLGVGLLSYAPVLHSYYSNDVLPTFNTSSGFFVPAGLGLKFDLARGINLDLGYQVNFVSSDDLDGYVYGSNNDKFSFTHIGLEFALGKSSKPQLATQRKSKAIQAKNAVPVQPLITPVQVQQTVIDSEKIKHDQLKLDLDSTNTRLARLTVDSDGDGVPDVKDKCPNTPPGTKVDSVGCPLPLPVIIKPEVKTEVADEDRKAVKIAIQNLEFFPGTSIIHSYSLNGLDKVAELLKSKKFHLKLEGYTDNAGRAADNIKLSKERADAVKIYLVGRGAASAQIETVGLGSADPVASNKTAEGRRLNRRVEFTIF
jgi:OmpA-OmpF porin, OOP family